MKKSLLFILSALALHVCVNGQTVYFTEDFESGIPAGWTTTGQWEHGTNTTIGSQYFAPPAHTQFMGFNDDALGSTVVASGRVTTAPIDLTSATGALVLYFDSYFVNGDYEGKDETAKIFVSKDDGATWSEIYNLEISGNWQQVGALLNYSGETIRLAFDYDDGTGWNYGWCFDNVKISSPSIHRDLSFTELNGESFLTGGLAGAEVYPGGIVKNNGVDSVTSIDLTWSDGTNTHTETISGLNIAFGASALVESLTPYIIGSGTSTISVSISNVNGLGDDEDVTNDAGGSFSITAVTPNPDKGILVEEATGTWCTWCPRGAVYMDLMTRRYPGHFVGVAVHNADPMTLAAYDNGITNFPGFTGFPSVIYNRTNILDPSEMENPFKQSVTQAPPAKLGIGAELDETNQQLTVSVDADFLQDVGAGYKLNAIIIEDDVTGTGSGYVQINAYSGGGNGPMDGYELLGGAVPADQMVYDHVGRALLGGFNGAAGSLPDQIPAGKRIGYNFNPYTIPASYDQDQMHIVAVLSNASGQVVNAKAVTLEEALANGIFVSGADEVFNNELVQVSPNPFSSVTYVNLNLETASDVSLEVYDAVGKLVASRDYGVLSGKQVLPFDGSTLNNGMYFLHVRIGEVLATKRVYLSK